MKDSLHSHSNLGHNEIPLLVEHSCPFQIFQGARTQSPIFLGGILVAATDSLSDTAEDCECGTYSNVGRRLASSCLGPMLAREGTITSAG